MDKAEHAKRLRDAIATSAEWTRADVAEATGKTYRAVSNWLSPSNPMLPTDHDRAILRRMFPGYDAPGDPVIVALGRSELVEWRQDAVRSVYRRHLAEQREEKGDTA